MARLRRIVLAGQPHLVIHRGNNGQAVFIDALDSECYLASLRECARAAGVGIHGYGLYTTEVRLLVTPDSPSGLARMMQGIGRQYVRVFNRRHSRSGTPWEGRFRSTVVEATGHFVACMRFVECGAEVGAMAFESAVSGEPGLWSSAGHHLNGRTDASLTEHPAFWALGNTPFDRESAYRRAIAQPQDPQQLATILLAALNGWVLGSDAFADNAGAVAGRRPRPAPPGRPRKQRSV